ncbi:myeloid differentiation primary response protein MyD88-like [Mytilus galloprovincialis]|uniref:Myeloid differentiation factor 88a n=1 Tax=Mytilus galloprovincialis TaxID=29158 RepID=J9T0D4_MYTGA|nr:myeloid differentiation factor 88a [Mytilus galloprovincialis]
MADEPISDDERIIQNLIAYCEDVPLKILRATSTKQLSQRLDVEGFVLGEYSNDWYGLAERTGYMTKEMRKFEQHESPTTALLNDWSTRLKMSPTVDTLLKYLVEIQRPDVVLDSEKSIRRDVEHSKQPARAPLPPKPKVPESDRYDAFVVYGNTERDIQFMKDMVNILEGEDHNIRLYVPGRDDLAGDEKYVVTAEMIANRCRRVIVVLSRGFEDSEDCDFALKLAQSLSPGAKTKRIIPILLDNVKIPLILNFVGTVNFTNPMQREWVWPRVAATIKCPLVPSIQDWQCTIDDLKNMKYDSKHVQHLLYGIGVACQEFPPEEEEEKKGKKGEKKKKT